MGKSKKNALVAIGKKKRITDTPPSTESEDDSRAGSPGTVRGGKGGRNGTIRHVYTTNSDMECIEEYIKPIYKDGEVILEVECGSNKALMYLSKLCQGSKGPCVEFQGSWLTPNEFQYVSGRETAKDWKRSIRHQGKSMKLLLTKGVLSVHSTVCDCDGCRLTSPVNRCRLAEKRKSVYSTNRKERLTLESFTSCDTSSSSATQDNGDKSLEENEVTEPDKTDIATSNEETLSKKFTAKNCSPLRESRLSNIIEQLRTSKEKETLSDAIGLKFDACDGVSPTCDENGNEGLVSPTTEPVEDRIEEPSTESILEEPPVPEDPPILQEPPIPEEPTTESLGCADPVALLSDTCPIPETVSSTKPSENSLDLKTELQAKEKTETEDVPIAEEIQQLSEAKSIPDIVPEKQEEEDKVTKVVEEESTEVKIEVICEVNEPNTIDVIENKDTKIEKMDTEIAAPIIQSEPKIPNTTLSEAPVKLINVRKDPVLSLKTEPSKVSSSEKVVKKDHMHSNHSEKKVIENKLQKLASPCSSRREKREERETKPKSIGGKKSSPAAPSQDYPPSVSCPTALPASVPEQFFTGDIPGAKYSDFIRLLAASHLGGHIPLAPDRLIGENLQAFPLASNFNGLPHPFPAYPFFPHQLPLKDTPPFQMPAMSMPPPFLPPYMYRPFGLLPHTMLDPAKYAQLHSGSEAFRPTPSESAAEVPRKRLSDSESALDLSTKRLKFDDRLVSSSGSNYQLPRKSPSQTTSFHKEKTHSASRHDRESHGFSSRTGGKMEEMKESLSRTETNLEVKSNSRRECSCLSTRKDDIRSWSVTEVGQFLKKLDGCSVYADRFREHRVDGKSLPLLTVEHLVKNIGMKLGPAVLLTETVAKRLKVSKHAHRKCQKCEGKPSGLNPSISTRNIEMGRVF